MKQAIIDIGSNSMRLTVYQIYEDSFKILFKEKIMAGLAGYVEDETLSEDGIECAYNGLLDFKSTVDSLGLSNVAVFATASLRNIENTDAALAAIKAATGYSVEVISGEEEALLGYAGAMKELDIKDGAFIDVGGASTEIAVFENGQPLNAVSFPVGSLSLYRACVRKIMPGDGSVKRLQKTIADVIDKKSRYSFERHTPLVGVGGTSRAVLKIAKRLYDLPEDCCTVSAEQLDKVCSKLFRADKETRELILKLEPDRIHTIVPGVMILQHIFHLFEAEELVISKYGVREGYLCQKVLQTCRDSLHTPKTEN